MSEVMEFTADGYAIEERGTGHCAQHGEFPRWRTRFGWAGVCLPCRELEIERSRKEEEERLRREGQERLLEYARIPPRFRDRKLSTYRPQTNAQQAALDAASEYLNNAGERVKAGTCLVFLGNVGLGKTHLLCAMVRGLAMLEIPALYTTSSDFLAAISNRWDWHGEEKGGAFVSPTVLAMDELFLPTNEESRASLFALLDRRYRDGKPTLIASNLTWAQMKEGIGVRFCDRLLEGGGEVLALDGKSARK